LVRQLVCETALLSAIAVAAALVIARIGLPLMVALLPPDVPRLADAGIDLRALAFTLAIGVLTTALSALTPAVKVPRGDLDPTLGRRAPSVASTGLRQPARRALIVGELALAIVLLTAAGLLARSIMRLGSLDRGFTPANLLAVRFALPSETMKDAD